jgi:hypothetical protein
MKQLELITLPKDVELERNVEKLKSQYDTLRKSQFARIAELKKMYEQTQHELNELKAAMSMVRSWGELFEKRGV